MRRNTSNSNDLVSRRTKFLLDNTGIDYIIETRLDGGREFTEFITSQGGDVARQRVYGTTDDDFVIYLK